MPASAITVRDAQVMKVDNQGKTGSNLVLEIFEVTFATDKTIELDIQMSVPMFVSAQHVHGTTPSSLTWSSDLIKDPTTGKLTFCTSANSTEVWRVFVWGLR